MDLAQFLGVALDSAPVGCDLDGVLVATDQQFESVARVHACCVGCDGCCTCVYCSDSDLGGEVETMDLLVWVYLDFGFALPAFYLQF